MIDFVGTCVDRNTRVGQLRQRAVRASRRMYLPEYRLFAFRIRRTRQGNILEGLSRRYTAIVLLGLKNVSAATARYVLAGQSPSEVLARLGQDIDTMQDLGEIALSLWAARLWDEPWVDKALRRLEALEPELASWPTVEKAWALSALSIPSRRVESPQLARKIAESLLTAFESGSGLFAHGPRGSWRSWLCGSVTCFADQVYPIQALAYYYMVSGDTTMIEPARLCAERLCELQGPAGQWWWHYDLRTAQVVERYPVYAVHQDSMTPMAFRALKDACGADYEGAVKLGLDWLESSPEISGSLIDPRDDFIWRKVSRHEPGKLVRILQASAVRIHPSLRMPLVESLFRPGYIDFESRPYHMGWILFASS